jgi:hypothetical protein
LRFGRGLGRFRARRRTISRCGGRGFCLCRKGRGALWSRTSPGRARGRSGRLRLAVASGGRAPGCCALALRSRPSLTGLACPGRLRFRSSSSLGHGDASLGGVIRYSVASVWCFSNASRWVADGLHSFSDREGGHVYPKPRSSGEKCGSVHASRSSTGLVD